MYDPQKYRVLASTARLVKRVGFKRADEVIGFLHDWQLFMTEHGRAPASFGEYVRWTTASRATCYRRLDLLRSAFPEAGPAAVPTDFLPGVLGTITRELAEA